MFFKLILIVVLKLTDFVARKPLEFMAASVSPGSYEEREAFKRANHQNKLLQQQQNHGLRVSIKVGADLKKGCDFDVYAVVSNHTQSEKKCRLLFSSCAIAYSGSMGENCGFKDLLNVELAPGAGKQVIL